MQITDIWQATLGELKLQMTTATFDTWLAHTTGQRDGNTVTVTVRNAYAKDWLENRLHGTILRTVARLTGETIKLRFVVASDTTSSTGEGAGPPADPHPGMIQDSDLERDMPPDCQAANTPLAIKLINFDPRGRGFVQVSNYALIYWQPLLALYEREAGSRATGLAFRLWITLRAFAAHWNPQGGNDWPTIGYLALITAHANRHRLLGRGPHGSPGTDAYRKPTVGALAVLEDQRILYITSRHAGGETQYVFKLLDTLPLLTEVQVKRLPTALQEAHQRELARADLDLQEWKQYTLPMLLP